METERILKFFLVVFCFINSLYARKGYAVSKKDTNLLRVGMLFTVFADYSMVLLDDAAPGIFLFCIVQTIYNYRYTNAGRTKVQVFIGAVVFGICLLFFRKTPTVVLAATYSIFLFYSVSGAFMVFKTFPRPGNALIVAGMVLFAMCDIFVMLYNLPIAVLEAPEAHAVIEKLIWVCYLPGQVLLSCSGRYINLDSDI